MQALSAPKVILPHRQFAGRAVRHRCVAVRPQPQRLQRSVVFADGTSLQFIRGVPEPSVPDVQLTRSKDGTNGTATFVFSEPSVFEASEELDEITGLYMEDAEGVLTTVDVQAKFVNGKPDRIEARYVMRSSLEWDRFMRFMERFADDKGLGFNKA